MSLPTFPNVAVLVPGPSYRCHQCYGLVAVEEIAHVDMYADVCWIQCSTCQAAFGPCCGIDRRVNPHRHGYFNCPLRPHPDSGLPANVTPIRSA